MDYEGASASLEKPSDIEKNGAGVVKRWLLEIKLADKRESEWRKKGEKVWDRYRQKQAKRHSFNILWANTETLRPAVYNSLPKPDVRRRFKDADPLGKAVSEVLSRSLEYGLDTTDFDSVIKSCVLDMLLPGRGVARVRYVPSLQQVGVTQDTHVEGNEQHDAGGEALEGDEEELEWEQSPPEHVQWDDFRVLCPAKEWCEVSAIGFRHKMTREGLEDKFGDVGAKVQLNATDDEDVKAMKDESLQETFKTAEVWEIWDKDKKQVLFISEGYKDGPLETIADPLRLQGFFPVPAPLMSVEDSSSLIPVPLYEMYKEQADELDTITARINRLVKGLKFRGIYDATLSELSELMRGEDNDLIPAENVTALLERGGLEKAIWFMPIEQAAMVLKELYVQREQAKQVIYEITGISDILRGSTNANETATAQQIKNQWGSNRLKRMQSEVARFIRDILRIQAEIIGEHFNPETVQTMTGIQLPTMEQKQQALMRAQTSGQPPDPAMVQSPTWEDVIQVLKDDKLRTYKVDVETDSTVAASIEGDMDAMQKLLGGLTSLMQGFGPAVQMGAMPVDALKEIMLAVIRRARLGNAVEDALDKVKQPPPQQQQLQDNSLQVEQIKQQGTQQLEMARQQHEAQLEQARNQMEAEREAQKAQLNAQIEQMKVQAQSQSDAQRLEFDRWKAELDANTKIVVAELSAKTSMDTAALSASAKDETTQINGDGTAKPKAGLSALVEAMNSNMEKLMQSQQDSHAQLVEVMTRPRKAIRGPDGRIAGVQ